MPSYGPMTFIWTGMDTLQANIRMASPRATAAMGNIIDDVLYDVYQQSQQQVPVDTGALRSSGHLDPLETGPGTIVGTIGYGAPYAFFVHEDLHANHPHGGKAKFLEDPLRNALNDLTSKTRDRLESAVVGQGIGAGSTNHSIQGSSMALGSRARRSLSQRRGARKDQISEMLHQAESYRHLAPHERPMIITHRGGLGQQASSFREEKQTFHYEPPQHPSGETMGRIPRVPSNPRVARYLERKHGINRGDFYS